MSLLEILKPDEFVSGQEIARALNISRAGVHKQIQNLRNLGYAITGATNSGYMLESRPDLVTGEELKYFFKRYGIPGHNVHYFPVTTSTQDEAKNIADKNSSLPSIVIAERQTGSYGRRRRQWLSPEGGLWFSLILKPAVLPEKIPQINLIASLAVCRAVEIMFGAAPLIKWPNDVTLDGKKFAGILTEMSAEVGKLNWVIIGAGINVNNSAPPGLNQPAVSLADATGEKINRAQFLSALLSEFYGLYGAFLKKGFAGFEKEYNNKSLLAGKIIKIDPGAGVIEGKVIKVDGEGYLNLAVDGGRKVKILAGDIISIKAPLRRDEVYL